MPLIKCPECGKTISNTARRCPECGCNIRGKQNKTIILIILAIFALIVIVGALYGKISGAARMNSEAMENTIMTGQEVQIDRSAYKESAPERYDVVVFKYPDDKEEMFVDRIIGLPGETVQMVDGKVYINGEPEPLDDSFCPEKPLGDFGPYQVPESAYFMLGDNRNYSKDSRFWANKYVPKEDILGEVELD